MYDFRHITLPDDLPNLSGVMREESPVLQEASSKGTFGEYMAHFRGALLRLFGPPRKGWGDVRYEYVLEASDNAGNTWIVVACEGDSGPIILGDEDDPSIYDVAQYLQTLIDSTPPADFEATYYSSEYDATVTYGCQQGALYYAEKRGRQT